VRVALSLHRVTSGAIGTIVEHVPKPKPQPLLPKRVLPRPSTHSALSLLLLCNNSLMWTSQQLLTSLIYLPLRWQSTAIMDIARSSHAQRHVGLLLKRAEGRHVPAPPGGRRHDDVMVAPRMLPTLRQRRHQHWRRMMTAGSATCSNTAPKCMTRRRHGTRCTRQRSAHSERPSGVLQK
jgi:hypothetical protein